MPGASPPLVKTAMHFAAISDYPPVKVAFGTLKSAAGANLYSSHHSIIIEKRGTLQTVRMEKSISCMD
jgi:hypothetical protein